MERWAAAVVVTDTAPATAEVATVGDGGTGLAALDARISGCRACPRLVEWREEVARTKRAAFADQEYWGRPVPGFGPPDAALLIVGLAPAAHGGEPDGADVHR